MEVVRPSLSITQCDRKGKSTYSTGGRCCRAVDSMSEESPKLIAIEEEADHQIVQGCRFGNANRATYESLDPCPQIHVFARNGLLGLFTDDVLLWDEMPLV